MAKKSTPKKPAEKFLNPITENPISLTPEVIKKAEQLFRIGITDNSVANMLGINPMLFREWLVKGGAYGTGLHGELYMACAKSVGSVELEMLGNIRKFALGSPAEYLMEPDEKGIPRVQRDGEGKPIVLKSEVLPNPQWSAWILEKRFKKAFGKMAEINLQSIIDENPFDSVLNKQQKEKEANSAVLTPQQEIDFLIMAVGRKQKQLNE